MADLVVGGSSGLGLELARSLHEQGSDVIVTGRREADIDFAEYRKFDLSGPDLAARIGAFVTELPPIKTMIYAAGYAQQKSLTELSVEEIEDMHQVGELGLEFFVRALLLKQGKLDELVTITSTSQVIPRGNEAPYAAVKAAAGHFTRSMSKDGRIPKVLVAAPAGMDTDFWHNYPEQDTSTMLNPKEVADAIMEMRREDYDFKAKLILRNPFRLEDIKLHE